SDYSAVINSLGSLHASAQPTPRRPRPDGSPCIVRRSIPGNIPRGSDSMSIVLGCTQLDHLVETGLSAEETLRRQVWEILAGLAPQAHHPERRTVQRFPYPNLLYLTPVGDDGIT